MIRIDVLTLFPGMFHGPFEESILKRAAEAHLLKVTIHDIRDFATDRHRTADDAPFGGGAGQVLKVAPIAAALAAVERAAKSAGRASPRTIVLAAQGRRFTQEVAAELARLDHFLLVCGHYEGIDARISDHFATDAISLGDFIVTGGELPAMVVIDAVARLVPGVLGASESLAEESMTGGLLEYPHYTRPASYQGQHVPPILLSGDHRAIARWRRHRALELTFRARPDLLTNARLDSVDAAFLSSLIELSP